MNDLRVLGVCVMQGVEGRFTYVGCLNIGNKATYRSGTVSAQCYLFIYFFSQLKVCSNAESTAATVDCFSNRVSYRLVK